MGWTADRLTMRESAGAGYGSPTGSSATKRPSHVIEEPHDRTERPGVPLHFAQPGVDVLIEVGQLRIPANGASVAASGAPWGLTELP
jgi:hypothetical protein